MPEVQVSELSAGQPWTSWEPPVPPRLPANRRQLFHYAANCTHSRGSDIEAMEDAAVEVKYATILKHCLGFTQWCTKMGYGQGLHIKNDYMVSFHKSKFRGAVCYYVLHSQINYIWTKS